jgi:hypothetical protein
MSYRELCAPGRGPGQAGGMSVAHLKEMRLGKRLIGRIFMERIQKSMEIECRRICRRRWRYDRSGVAADRKRPRSFEELHRKPRPENWSLARHDPRMTLEFPKDRRIK